MADEENQTATNEGSSTASTAVDATTLRDNGYLKLASFMGEFPEYAIYRRFGTLNSMNLLLLQAELVELEIQLKQYMLEDNASPDLLTRLDDNDFLMMSGKRRARPKASRQWKTMMQIRQVLRQYNREVLVQSQLDRLSKPTGRDNDFLREWMEDPSKGNVYITSEDCDIWKMYDLRELQAVHAQKFDDAISNWVVRYVIYWYHELIGRFYKKPKKQSNAAAPAYSHTRLLRIVSTLSITLSCAFPVASICILYRIGSFEARLWVIVACTALFAGCVGAFSQGKRVETFAATMAFAAVQVVFISNSSPLDAR